MLEVGTTIGRYRIGAPLGEGGMGVVYRAYDTLLRRDVALKVLAGAGPARDAAESRARLLREARAAAALRHPNAVSVFDIGEIDGTTFIAMEVVLGSSLAHRLHDATLARETKLRWLLSLADVLASAHKVGLVHRDIKPDNVMVCADDSIKVLDFGIAKRSEDAEGAARDDATHEGEAPPSFKTAEGRVLGTPRYMAPEQKMGGAIDGRTDQYAWGLVACELLCGDHPQKANLDDLLRRAGESGLPRVVLETIERALSGRPSDRFGSMDDIVARLAPLTSISPPRAASTANDAPAPVVRDASTAPTQATAAIDAADLHRPSARPESDGVRRAWALRAGSAGLVVVLGVAGAALARRVAPPPDGGAGSASALSSAAPASAPRRIAVLPLDPSGSSEEHVYLADEATEELIGELSPEASLRVVARSSVMRYRADTRPIADVARELAALQVVTGRLRVEHDTFRLALELVDVATQTTLWSRTYSQKLLDLRSSLSDAGKDLRTALGVAVGIGISSGSDAAATRARHVPSSVAYTNYLRGRYFWNQRHEAGLTRAIGYFEDAVRADPEYADAYVGIAESYMILPYMKVMPDGEAESHVRPALDKALALDPGSSSAHAARASEHQEFRWGWAEAEREFKQALALDPKNAVAHQWYGELLSILARNDEAIAEMKLALDLDPVGVPLHKAYGLALFNARRYAEAKAVLERTVEMDTKQPYLHFVLGTVLCELGQYDAARAEFRLHEADHLGPQIFWRAWSLYDELYAAGRTGRHALATKLVRELEGTGLLNVQPYIAAVAYALAAEPDRMYAMLERAVTEHVRWTVSLNHAQPFDPYRRDERFERLRRRVGFDPSP